MAKGQFDKKVRIDPVIICGQCKKGFHEERRAGQGRAARMEPGCEKRACECWCRMPIVTSPPLPVWNSWMALEQDEEFVRYVAELRLRQIRVRQHPTTGDLVWYPPATEWPTELRAGLAKHSWKLVRALGANTRFDAPRRPLWRSGVVTACCGCGLSTAMYDGLGQPRHPMCGALREQIKPNAANLTEYMRALKQNNPQPEP